jgi:hypothetical protein
MLGGWLVHGSGFALGGWFGWGASMVVKERLIGYRFKCDERRHDAEPMPEWVII